MFVPEYEIETRARDRRYVDGALLYELRMPFGYWEAKDEKDDLDAEIEHKFRRGYLWGPTYIQHACVDAAIDRDRLFPALNPAASASSHWPRSADSRLVFLPLHCPALVWLARRRSKASETARGCPSLLACGPIAPGCCGLFPPVPLLPDPCYTEPV